MKMIRSLLFLASLSVAAAKPHLLVYLSDDHSQADSSLYGNPNIPTPNLEQLAADGIVFHHAYVASPSCAPSRAAMLTGLMPARNGAEDNHSQPRPGVASLVESIKRAGYETAAFGKVAHGKGRPVTRHGFDHVDPKATTQVLARTVGEFLAARDSDKPLCLFVGTSNPHVPWPKGTSFDPAKVDLPPHHLDTPATRSHRARYYQEIKDLDRLLGELRQLAAEHLGDDVLFLHTSDHGAQWPFGKWTLYDYGTRVPMVAAWPGTIEGGRATNAMVSWVDLLPTLVEAGGGDVPDDLDGRSFLPVLTGDADTHRDQIFTTHSGDRNMNVYPSRALREHGWKLIHNLRPDLAFTSHSDLLRKDGAGGYWSEWTELAAEDTSARDLLDDYYRSPEWELYHVAEDPWERQNLADDPAHAGRLEAMKNALSKWRKSQGDAGEIFGKPRPLDRPETWSPEHFPKAGQR